MKKYLAIFGGSAFCDGPGRSGDAQFSSWGHMEIRPSGKKNLTSIPCQTGQTIPREAGLTAAPQRCNLASCRRAVPGSNLQLRRPQTVRAVIGFEADSQIGANRELRVR